MDTAGSPVVARVVAFVAILLGGGAGALIGYSVVDIQCSGDCTTPTGLGLLGGAIAGAIGVAVIAVLVLRAMGEWRTIQARAEAPTPSAQPRSDSRRKPSA